MIKMIDHSYREWNSFKIFPRFLKSHLKTVTSPLANYLSPFIYDKIPQNQSKKNVLFDKRIKKNKDSRRT